MTDRLPQMVTDDLGPPPKATTRGFWFHCPWHSDLTPSLLLNEYGGTWFYRCWSCGATGKAWDWATGYRRLSPREAHRLIYDGVANKGRPAGVALTVSRARAVKPPDKEWQDKILDFALEAAARLQEDERIMRYLTEARGLTEATIKKAMLGFNPAWVTLPTGGRMPPGITIPGWSDHSVMYLKLRCTRQAQEDTGQKYLYARGSVAGALYGGSDVGAYKVALLTEGEIDALTFRQHSDDVYAVTLGSATAIPTPATVRALMGVQRLLVIMDSDRAGQAAIAKWKDIVPWVDPIAPPDGVTGKDINAWHLEGVDLWKWVSRHLMTVRQPA